MRVGLISPRVLVGLALLPIAACGGDDLLLPSSGAPAELRLVSGDLQQAEVGTTLPDPLVVEALDANGRPVAGSSILFRFELDIDGGRVSPDTVQTNDSGLATAQVRLGEDPGAHPVEAVVVDGPSGLRVRFLLTALAPEPPQPPRDGGGGGDDDGGFGDGGGGDGGGGGGGGQVDGGGGGGNDDGGRGKGKGKDKGRGGDDDDDDDGDDD